jgi:hypothetical protein
VHGGKENHLSQTYGALYLDVAVVSDLGDTLQVVIVNRLRETANTIACRAERYASRHV